MSEELSKVVYGNGEVTEEHITMARERINELSSIDQSNMETEEKALIINEIIDLATFLSRCI